MGEETTIMGTVLSVVFQNEENGYAVLRLVTDDGELLTLVGCVPCAAPGENLTATGSFSSHPQYGEQFSASEVERYLPSNETEILNYLASGVVRGVGPATAEKLVARFGIETLQVLESEPEKLTAIKGMTARRAQEISAAFNEQMGLRRVMEFLAHYDLPAALSVPLYRRFGANAMAALERNPYLLSDSAFGVDFSVCDEIALSMGFGGDASLRTEAGLTFELSHNRDAGGHVFLPREKLLAATVQLLDCDVDAVEKSLDDLIAIHRIVQEGVANVTACYLRQSWEDETYVVTRIEAMLADKPRRPARRRARHQRNRARAGRAVRAAPASGRRACGKGRIAAADRRSRHGQNDERARHRRAFRAHGIERSARRPHGPRRQAHG